MLRNKLHAFSFPFYRGLISRAETAKKSDRKACVVMHVQSVQSNVLLVNTHSCLNFFTFLKLPNETNRTDISFLFMVFYIMT